MFTISLIRSDSWVNIISNGIMVRNIHFMPGFVETKFIYRKNYFTALSDLQISLPKVVVSPANFPFLNGPIPF
jgi:hypothetical protein